MDRKRITIIIVIVLILLATAAMGTVFFLKSESGNSPAAGNPASKTEIGKAPVIIDMDNDGLTDEQEKTHGTDPLKADTDGDTYKDGEEVANGYDPLKPAPGDKIVFRETVCPENTAATPEEAVRLAAEAGQKGDGNGLLCYFTYEARGSLAEPLKDSANAKSLGKTLSNAVKTESTESDATFESAYKEGDADYSSLIYVIKSSEGQWMIEGF
jgi:hypothetical protein